MKKEIWLLILLAFVLAGWRYKPLNYQALHTLSIDTLTVVDRDNYRLSIDPGEISKLKDTVAYYLDTVFNSNHIMVGLRPENKMCDYASIPVKLSNNSDDTLKYINWDCSWNEIYHTDNKQVSPQQQVCFKNGPQVITLLPHSFSVSNLQMLFDKDKMANSNKFRIAMTLFKSESKIHLYGFFDHFSTLKYDSKYLIWSNEVVMPVPK